jgi:hypothetical protein
MSPLTSSHQREIRQLWDAAMTYWGLAKDIVNDMPDVRKRLTCDEISKYYDSAIPTDPNEKCLCILLAHLSSAAIRLVTIDERLQKAGCARVFINEYGNLYGKSQHMSQADCSSWLNTEFANFVHQILRDNAAHIEEANEKDKDLYLARQEVVRKKTVEEIFDAFSGVME